MANIQMPERTTIWAPEQLQSIWAQLEDQITPFTEVLCIIGPLWRALDGGARLWIADNFMYLVQESVMYCRDGTGIDRYFLGNSRHFIKHNGMLLVARGSASPPFWILRPNTDVQTASVVPPGPPARVQKPPRPPNAYILYRKDRQALVKQANPGISNNQISRILGAAWHKEPREVRAQYKRAADRAKEEHREMHPDYQYQPRKASQRKRRIRENNGSGSGSGSGPGSAADDHMELIGSPEAEISPLGDVDAEGE